MLNVTSSYDNSGQRKDYPYVVEVNILDHYLSPVTRLWHTNPSFVARTNAIIKQIASMYKDMSGAVPIIAALNESVNVQLMILITDRCNQSRPAGYFGEDVLHVTRQVSM